MKKIILAIFALTIQFLHIQAFEYKKTSSLFPNESKSIISPQQEAHNAALCRALIANDLAIATELITQGAQINAFFPTNIKQGKISVCHVTPLIYAAQQGNREM